MALLIPAAGALREVTPANGRAFTLAEMQGYVGGYLELAGRLPGGRLAWCNEEGKLLGLPENFRATALVGPQLQPGDVIAGDLLITTEAEAGEDAADPDSTHHVEYE